jgi:hypothetical protein
MKTAAAAHRCVPSNALVTTLIVVAIAWLVAPPGEALAQERRSGTVIGVDDRTRTIVIEEVGPWRVQKGVTQVMRHTIVIAPSARITSYIRVNVAGRFGGDFLEVPFELSDVAIGDFVTVEGRRVGRRLIASRIDVAQPGVAHHGPAVVMP